MPLATVSVQGCRQGRPDRPDDEIVNLGVVPDYVRSLLEGFAIHIVRGATLWQREVVIVT